jgi:hypothetical protein
VNFETIRHVQIAGKIMKEFHSVDIMPKSNLKGRDVASTIDTVILTARNWMEGDPVYTGVSTRYVMGYPLPDWQRGLVWSDEQCIKLIDSIWRKASIGSFMINIVDDTREPHPYDGLLLDGQQRLHAIQRYLNDDFSTKDIHGNEVLWSELPLISQRRFKNSHFPSIQINSKDRAELIDIYNTLNFGGVAHTEADRAV